MTSVQVNFLLFNAIFFPERDRMGKNYVRQFFLTTALIAWSQSREFPVLLVQEHRIFSGALPRTFRLESIWKS